MVDPNFSETVIYMVEHSERGAMGLVINRPLGLAPLGRLLEKLDGQAVASDQEIRIYAGGPVEPGRGFVLHSSDGAPDGGGPDGADLAVTGNLRVLRALADGEGPAQAIFLFGYAGWGPGQLEAEIAQGAWDIIAPDAALVFDEPDDSRWKRALARHGVEL
jgi:putative transcriptional regulator